MSKPPAGPENPSYADDCVETRRAFDPFQRPVSGSKSPEETGSEQVTPDTTPPLDGAAADDENTRPAAQQRSRTLARTTPGGGQPGPAGGDRFRSPGAVWRRQQSPGVNLLALLQSPQQPAKSDLFLSPGLKVWPYSKLFCGWLLALDGRCQHDCEFLTVRCFHLPCFSVIQIRPCCGSG